MVHCYLFEAKSIQQYLFSSGKLRDVIAASERLDRLIDSSEHSVLAQVIASAGLTSDLCNVNQTDTSGLIRFLRCKGGAFYAYSVSRESLLTLRSAWTLAVQQLFPSMVFTDALCEGESLHQAMDRGHAQLAADRNCPKPALPFATSVMHRYPRTGNAEVLMSTHARYGSGKALNDGVDLDTEHHRQAFKLFKLREFGALQDRYTPNALAGKVKYPVNLETEFYVDADPVQPDIKDIALIHIDGNGLGLLLMKLKEALANADDEQYRRAFRAFSEALTQSTIDAAKQATALFIERCGHDEQGFVQLRPIVLGGDDITLLCQAQGALDYSLDFCREFEKASSHYLESVVDQYLTNSDVSGLLTASGGIAYHKAGHPFLQSHELVESLAQLAKGLTRQYAKPNRVGPAAMAIYRTSSAVTDELGVTLDTKYCFEQSNGISLSLGQHVFLVDAHPEAMESDYAALQALLTICMADDAPLSIAKIRQMAGLLAAGDIREAQRLFNRAMKLSGKGARWHQAFAQLVPEGCDNKEWYWLDKAGKGHTVINDLLLLAHFSAGTVAMEEA